MTFSKRLFDLIIALHLVVMLLPVIAILAALLLVKEGRPVFYLSERMKSPGEGFQLVKFRTMKPVREDSGVSGGDKTDRISPFGTFLRRIRADELPQLWNVLKGDISFVGPRPPLRQYVEQFPEIYGAVLKSRPGITGLASLHANKNESYHLSQTGSSAETDEVYRRICIPRKAKLDLIYARRRSLYFDAQIMVQTLLSVLR